MKYIFSFILQNNQLLVIFYAILFVSKCTPKTENLNKSVYEKSITRSVGIAEELHKSIRGSGVLISSNQVITCDHILTILSSNPLLKVRGTKDEFLKVKNTLREPKLDLAILELDEEIPGIDELSSNNNPIVGEKIFTISNPYGLENSLLFGSISSLDTLGRDTQFPILNFIQVQNISYPGVSGAGVYTMDGRIIGINRAAYGFSANTGIGFVIPWDYVEIFLKESGK